MAMKSFSKDVTTAATAEPLKAASLAFCSIVIKAKAGNGGTIYVGDSDVDSTEGYPLVPGESVGWDSNPFAFAMALDFLEVYIDTDNSGDGVHVLYVEPIE